MEDELLEFEVKLEELLGVELELEFNEELTDETELEFCELELEDEL